jgi:hypothetical protein
MKSSRVLIAILAVTACGPANDPMATPLDQNRVSRLTDYSLVEEKVIQPRCLRCHDVQQPTMNSYNEVKSVIDSIHQAAVIEKNMPPDGPLTTSQMEILTDWINRGAP